MRMFAAVRDHWPEYLMEGAGLGCFMISACVFTALFEYPGSPIRQAMSDAMARRAFVGLAMGGTAVALIYSPWGRRSGAHLNPSVTLTLFSLGKIRGWDAIFYIAAQFAGSVLGVVTADGLLGGVLRHESINYIATIPGTRGATAAFWSEFLISGLLMATVLVVSSSKFLSRLDGCFVGALIALYVTFEAPLSGMSMNPARTFGSALPAHLWDAWWVYLAGPVLGMLVAGQIYRLGANLSLSANFRRASSSCSRVGSELPDCEYHCGR